MPVSDKLEKYQAKFRIENNDFARAYQRAKFYGESMVEFRFAIKYFLISTDTEIHCIPTNNHNKHLADYI